MPGPGMELIGEEEIQEVLDVLRDGYLFRYGVSLGDYVDPRFKGKVLKLEQRDRGNVERSLCRCRQFGHIGIVDRTDGTGHRARR